MYPSYITIKAFANKRVYCVFLIEGMADPRRGPDESNDRGHCDPGGTQ